MTLLPDSTELNEPIYRALLAEASDLLLAQPGRDTPEAARLEALAPWLEAYEDRHHHHPRLIP